MTDAAALASTYDPQSVEPGASERWEQARAFLAKPAADPDRPTFCVVIPPPNVTGALHLGHALNNTLQDILVRYHRMLGYDTIWQAGTDHAGIATQAVVERRIRQQEGKSRHDLGREELVKRSLIIRRLNSEELVKVSARVIEADVVLGYLLREPLFPLIQFLENALERVLVPFALVTLALVIVLLVGIVYIFCSIIIITILAGIRRNYMNVIFHGCISKIEIFIRSDPPKKIIRTSIKIGGRSISGATTIGGVPTGFEIFCPDSCLGI